MCFVTKIYIKEMFVTFFNCEPIGFIKIAVPCNTYTRHLFLTGIKRTNFHIGPQLHEWANQQIQTKNSFFITEIVF